MLNLTALQIINQAASELGLQQLAEVAASTELTGVQLMSLLNASGRDLITAHAWSQLTKELVFPIFLGGEAVEIPPDFYYYIDNTVWDRSRRLPVLGPLSAAVLQALITYKTPLTHLAFRFFGGFINFYGPIPETGTLPIKLEYVTDYWVQDGSVSTQQKPQITADADVPLLDSNLLVKALKVKMWNAKGLDTMLLQQEYQTLFSTLTGKDKGAPIVNITRPRGNFLYRTNVPELGYGE